MQTKRRSTRKGERTRAEILAYAADMASENGLEGLTIGRLAAELGMSKSGLFAHFGSKEQLQLAAVDTAEALFVDQVIQPSEGTEPGRARLWALLEAWVAYVERSTFRGGCFFAAASLEFDGRSGAVRERIARLTRSWCNRLEDSIREACERGELAGDTDAAQLAFELHALVQEANWAYQLFNDPRAFERARRGIRNRLEPVP